MDDSKHTRKVVVHLPLEHARFLDQERNRLQSKVGKPFSTTEIVQLLIAQHKTRMEMRAENNPDSVAWMYRAMAEQTG